MQNWGKKEWIINYWLNKNENPFPEPYSIRQAFYTELPEIHRFIKEREPRVLENPRWARNFYTDFIRFLSQLVLEKKVSYRKIRIHDDSGAGRLIYQDYEFGEWHGAEEAWVAYPIEIWVENNATYNSLIPLFDTAREAFRFQINLLSQKGFAKTQQIEALYLDRKEDVEVILCFTDFDPSGYRMPGDLQNRLNIMGLETTVSHMGILPDQIPKERRVASMITYSKRDPRTKWFREKFKDDPMVQQGYGYEMQALNPTELRALVSQFVEDAINEFSLEKREADSGE